MADKIEKIKGAETPADLSTASTPAADSVYSMDPGKDEDLLSKKVFLADLTAKGQALYAHKSYDEACEVFSRASVLQADINGETAPENAEILFHYGRSLFKVGQSKSDVLGASAPQTETKKPKNKPKNGDANGKKKDTEAKTEEEKVTQEGVGIVAEEKGSVAKTATAKEEGKPVNKALFQFTGDENFDDSDEEEDPEEGDEEDDEDDDDLATAFEILDLARVCYTKRLEQLSSEEQEAQGKGKDKEAEGTESAAVRHVKERLADTHDCLHEISLENERFPQAVEDGRTALQYKLELYPEESEIIAEAHYKLSLALEFASVTTAGEDGTTAKREDMDQGLRDEAAKEMELAIQSFKLKLKNREVDLAESLSAEDNELGRKDIAEMKELIADMEQRLLDLRSDPINTKEMLGGSENPLGGILGAALGETSADAKARIDEAKKTANDLTNLVRKKKPKEEAPTEGNGKRKAEDEAEDEAAKRAKTEEPAASAQ